MEYHKLTGIMRTSWGYHGDIMIMMGRICLIEPHGLSWKHESLSLRTRFCLGLPTRWFVDDNSHVVGIL
jgi:hypothetical protein